MQSNLLSALILASLAQAAAAGAVLTPAATAPMPAVQWRAAMADYLRAPGVDLPALRLLVGELYRPEVRTYASEHLAGLEPMLQAKSLLLIEASRREDASLGELQALLSAMPLMGTVYMKLPENGYSKGQFLSNAYAQARGRFTQKVESRLNQLAGELAEPGPAKPEDDRRIAAEMGALLTAQPWDNRAYASMQMTLRQTLLRHPKERVMRVTLGALELVSRRSIADQGPVEDHNEFDFLAPQLIETIDRIAECPRTMPRALSQALNLLYYRISRASAYWQYKHLPAALKAMVKIARRSESLRDKALGTLRVLKARTLPYNFYLLPYHAPQSAENWFDWAISLGR